MAYKFQLGTAKISGSIIPTTDDSFDLGEAGKEFANLFIDGTAHIDAINLGGTVVNATAAELNKLAGSDSNSAANKMIILDANGDFEMQDNDKIHFGDGADANIHWDGNSLEIGADTNVNINIGGTTSEVTFGDNVTITGDLTINGTTTTVNSTTIEITSSFTFEGNVPNSNETVFGVTNPTADTTINLPALSAGTYHVPVLSAVSTTAITATPEEINYLDNDDLVAADITKLAALTATAAEINYLDNDNLTAADITKLAAIDASAAEINLLDAGAGSSVALAAGDGFIMFDASDSDNAKKILASDIKTYVAGTNVYQLSGSGTNDGIIGAASGSGFYYNVSSELDEDGLSYESKYMISGSGWTIGDTVRIKAPQFASGGKISIFAQSSSAGDFAHSIENIQSDTSGSNMAQLGLDANDEPAIVLESSNAAVTLIHWGQNTEGSLTTFFWSIV